MDRESADRARLRALVVDDEPLARKQLRRLLAATRDVDVLAECEAGDEAVHAIGAHRPDVVFLDVQMPRLDGFGVVDAATIAIGAGQMPAIVFVTAHDEYAVSALRARAVDYLVKPVEPAELAAAIARVRERQRDGGGAPPGHLRRLVLKDDGRMRVLDVSDVDWLEARDNYVVVHAGGASAPLRTTLGALIAQLDPSHFARVHRSTAVNLSRVRELQPWFRGEYLLFLRDGTRLAIGPTYRDAFLARLQGLGA